MNCRNILKSIFFDWFNSHFLKKKIDIIKKIDEVIKPFAQIEVYRNAGRKKIQDDNVRSWRRSSVHDDTSIKNTTRIGQEAMNRVINGESS